MDASDYSRSCDLILGLESVMTLDLLDVFSGQIELNAALHPVPQYENLYLTCASLCEPIPASDLVRSILALHSMCDILVVDMPAGQNMPGRGIMRAGDENLFVLRPDGSSVRAAERMIAMQAGSPASTSLILNRIGREKAKRKIQFTKDTVQNLLDLPVLACIPDDPSIPECECHCRSAIECDGPAWTALSGLAKALLGNA